MDGHLETLIITGWILKMIKWCAATNLWLFTIEEYEQLPNDIELTSITGSKHIKKNDNVDMDTRGGYLAYGVIDPMKHPLADLFIIFQLTK